MLHCDAITLISKEKSLIIQVYMPLNCMIPHFLYVCQVVKKTKHSNLTMISTLGTLIYSTCWSTTYPTTYTKPKFGGTILVKSKADLIIMK